MNLGVVSIESFLLIIVASFAIAFGLASLLRLKNVSWHTIVLVSLPLWLMIGFALLDFGHQRLYAAWHRWQNAVVPQQGCIYYDPQFNRLLAKYSMKEADFLTWTTNHPWRLEQDGSPREYDLKQFGVVDPEFSFSNEPAPNGAQLRVYYKSGVAYIAYYAN
ncbi:MAG: hypothetical protein IT422_08035 [Pirellulaceae bacterium]|nr:hypothetical protein [Pirellulaceae bacterium]